MDVRVWRREDGRSCKGQQGMEAKSSSELSSFSLEWVTPGRSAAHSYPGKLQGVEQGGRAFAIVSSGFVTPIFDIAKFREAIFGIVLL